MGTTPRAGESGRPCKRRSARIKLKIPVTISVGEVALKAETVSVSKHGAKIRITSTNQKLACGEQMRVAVRAGKSAQSARVVWLDKTSEPHCGIELAEGETFWGVSFPSKHIDEGPPQGMRAQATATTPATPPLKPAAPVATREVAGHAPAGAELCITPRFAEAVLQRDANDTRIMPARVTGVSAVRSPVAENVEVVFTRPDEATALLRDMVEPGTTVRLMFSKDRVVTGRVAAIGNQRQAGKWRIRIKCDAPCF